VLFLVFHGISEYSHISRKIHYQVKDLCQYILEVPVDEAPIDIANIVSFVEQLHVTPLEIRKSVEDLSWKV